MDIKIKVIAYFGNIPVCEIDDEYALVFDDGKFIYLPIKLALREDGYDYELWQEDPENYEEPEWSNYVLVDHGERVWLEDVIRTNYPFGEYPEIEVEFDTYHTEVVEYREE